MPRKKSPPCKSCGKEMRALQSVWACEPCGNFEFKSPAGTKDNG